MSRLITLPDGTQVRGCKNYMPTPKPALTIDTRVELAPSMDEDVAQEGTPISLYLQGDTTNTQTPLRVWLSGWTSPAVDITPEQFRAGIRLDSTKAASGRGPLMLSVTNGSYTLQRLALMMSSEMDESRLVSQFGQYYP